MPLFEYECGKCGEEFELLVAGDDETKKKCPKCGSAKVERKLSVFAAQSGSSAPCDGGVCAPGPSCPTCCPTGACGL